MEDNLKTYHSKLSLMKKGSHIIFHIQELHNKMECWKKKIELCKKWQELMNESNIEKYFWAKAINTSCYIRYCVSIRKIINNTQYELWINRKPNISYFHISDSYNSYIFQWQRRNIEFLPKIFFFFTKHMEIKNFPKEEKEQAERPLKK